jgi:DNA-binding transcriptional MerR regulator
MRISELAATTGVPVPTVKFYLREGLLPAGETTAVNQADYGPEHVRRLRLIRALTEIGGVRLRDVGRVLAAIDDAALPLHETFGVAQRALRPDVAEEPGSDAEFDRALGDVDAALALVDWQVTGDAPARRSLARTLVSLRRLGWQVSVDDVVRYANAIDPIAADEVEAVDGGRPRTESVERMVVGTVLLESVLADLRLLAHEHHSGRRARRKGLTARRGRPTAGS